MPDAAIDLDRAAHEHAQRLRAGEYSARALAETTLERVRAQETALGAYITLTEEEALAQADAADERLRSGDGGPLTGIPVAIKDLLSIAGTLTTAGSRMLEDYRPFIDCTVVARLREAGAVFVGKTNLDEFAMGSSTEHSAFGPTHNPWDLERVPGGSSGGSAATVASRAVPLSIGTDTGGSIRQPAALTGILGLKPTYGRVSRFGIVAFASSLEQAGPFGRDARDVAVLLAAIAGLDPDDSTTAPVAVPDYTAELERGLDGLRVGVPREFAAEAGVEPGVREAVEQAVALLEANGAAVGRDVSLPTAAAALPVYYLIAPSEASANLARYDGVKYGYSYHDAATMWEEMEQTRGRGFGDEVKRRIMLGTYALSAGYYDAYYLKAQKVRTLIRAEFDRAFADYDVLVTPTSPSVAFRIGEKTADPLSMYLSDLFTIPVNIAGLPGLSIPCGFSEGLPVGLQLIGRPFEEGTLLRIAHAYASLTDWHQRRPQGSRAEVAAVGTRLGLGGAAARTVLLLSLVSLLTDISSEMTLTVLPIFLTGTLGVSVAAVGVIEGIGESAAAATRLFAGRLSDRLERRLPLVAAGYALSAVVKPLFVLVTGAALAGVLRFADRLGKGTRSAPRDALIADVAPGEHRGLTFGIHRAADTVGALLGVLAAAAVVAAAGGGLTRGDFQRVVLVAAVPAFLAVLVLAAVRERRASRRGVPARAPLLALPASAAERRYLLVVALFALGNSSDAFIVLRLLDVGAGVVGALMLMALMNAAYVVLAPPAGGLSDRLGRRRLLVGGYAAYAAIYAGFAGVGSVPLLLPLLLLYGGYYGATEGITRAYVADLAPAGGRGGTFGWFHAVTAATALPASVIAGALWTTVAPAAAFAFGSVCALAAAALLLTVHSPPPAPAAAAGR